jgi:ABC-type glycerol-3-phosphate transport system substrate-binding protein
MTKFKIIVYAVCVLGMLAGVAAFALYKGSSSTTTLAPITVWGTFPAGIFNDYVAKINNTLGQSISVKYVQESSASFSQDFVAALARGNGPDAILIPADIILPQEDKLALIPYTALSQRTFMDSYIQEASIYISANGILALPFSVDPLVMYWNRDTFDAAGFATYPRFWDEFAAISKKLTIKDQNGNIRKSAIALGEFSNINNAREILGTFLMQLGNPVTKTGQDGEVVTTLKLSATPNPTSALKFFTQFADPSDPNYSWNRSLPDAKAAFLSGMLATYFGFASELSDIRAKNQNLNFDAAPLPQLRVNGQKATYAKMYGLSLVRTSANLNSASMYLPSVRREVIAQGSADPYVAIFEQAALVGNTWLDADPEQSRQIMGEMVQGITSGQKSLYQAVQDAGDQYDLSLKRAMQ